METTQATPKSRALAAMDAVEIKVTIRPDQELRAERAMEVNEDTAEVRVLYSYDALDLRLFNAGVALRARLIEGCRRFHSQVPSGKGGAHFKEIGTN